jgi:PhnB protein
MSDPFDALAMPYERRSPRPSFARELRARLEARLGLDETELDGTESDETEMTVIPLPERKTAMPASTTTPRSTTTSSTATAATEVTPYLAVSDGAAALDWYAQAFGAEEQFRVVGHDGRLGHAEFSIGAARFMVSDEYPEVGVRSPTTLGGTGTALHLTVSDVDAIFARAVEAGATPQSPPADQPHGARAGTLLDPFGHRWMLSQPLEAFDLDTYRERSAGSGFEVIGAGPDERVTVADRPGTGGGIWAGAFYEDALGAIRFLVDVFGFEEQLVVTGADGRTVVHSQLRWPEGGVVQVGTYDPANEFSHPPGAQALYVVTADPHSVWDRCRAAGVAVVREPESPDYDPEGMGFSVRDPEGNIWSFGSYGLGSG